MFPGFLGNDNIKEILGEAIRRGRVPHAVIISGESGCGKRTFARLLAQALVCTGTGELPCGSCPACVKAKAGSHPDIRVEEGSGASHQISVEAAREIIAEAYKKPMEAELRVFLLFIRGRISEETQNKLLKVIEEPPGSAAFIITCRDPGLLLGTIRSRAVEFELHAPGIEDAARFISAEKSIAYDEALRLSEENSGNIGSIYEALESTGSSAFEIAKRMGLALTKSGGHSLLAAAAPLIKEKELFPEALKRLENAFRDACVMRSGGTCIDKAMAECTKGLQNLTLGELLELSEVCRNASVAAERNANMTLLVTAFCAKLMCAAGR